MAEAYNYARRGRSSVTAEVARALGVSKNTAPKLIQRAREAGLLPRTTPGKVLGREMEP